MVVYGKEITESHEKVLVAAKKEFLECGFEKASIRSIGKRAGMSSAGLYRHCKNKEDLFSQILSPLIHEMTQYIHAHRSAYGKAVETGFGFEDAAENSEITMFRELSLKYREEMKLLLCHSSGTQYEHFLHELVEVQEEEMLRVLEELKSHGKKVLEITPKEMHMLISAYITALTEPIIHDYSREETEKCLETISKFFMPGWMNIMGI